MGSKVGVLKIAAKRTGCSIDDYLQHINNNEKYCWKCKAWKTTNRFGVDNSRSDGLTASCFDCRRKTGKPKNKLTDNKRQARNAVNDAVRRGRMVKANTLPCIDCGKSAQQYHHHINYEKSNWLNVQPLCAKCHKKRH